MNQKDFELVKWVDNCHYLNGFISSIAGIGLICLVLWVKEINIERVIFTLIINIITLVNYIVFQKAKAYFKSYFML